ncbi:SRPBCC family protein [Actinoplanes sp. NPDC026619]|uniref:SRPBCC family protein n=1 Tax=Actinoplanes sp. NPDC026619 TaxID=3155798 RepID=UPI0033E9E657
MAPAKVTLPSDTQILITREFDAPRHLIWRAYTEPDLIKRWWSGERGAVTSVEVDLQVGGHWRYVMTANGGFEVAFHGEFREITAPERLVNTEAFEGIPDPDGNAALVTVTLTEKDGRTYIEVLTEMKDKAGRDAIIESGMEGGMQESYNALEKVARSLA